MNLIIPYDCYCYDLLAVNTPCKCGLVVCSCASNCKSKHYALINVKCIVTINLSTLFALPQAQEDISLTAT